MKKRYLSIILSIITSSFMLTGVTSFASTQEFEYPYEIISSDYYTQEVDYSLWEKFIKYDLCITDYDSLTDAEKELCRFIFETERSADGTVRCERARRTLAGETDLGNRITLEELDSISGIYDKYLSSSVSNYDYYKYNYYYYRHCIPDVKHIDGNINVDEYWLDETGTQKILYQGYTDGFSCYQNYGYCKFDESSQNWNFETIERNIDISQPVLLEKDSFIYTILPNNTITIVSTTLKNIEEPVQEPVIIPDEIDGIPVKAIEMGAFGSSPITEIVLPDTITYIGAFAFSSCKYLEKINIPESLEFMGEYVFRVCKSLEYIEINCPNLKLPGYLFQGSGLKSADICAKIIDEQSFNSCSSLENITFSEGTKLISADSFVGCTNLKNVELPSDLIIMGEGLFAEIPIKSIMIPPTVEVIGALPRASGIVQYSLTGDIPATDPLTEEPVCVFDSDCIIYGYKGTEAETYANEWNLTFVALDSSEIMTGDANGDNEISISDAVAVSAFISNAEKNPLSLDIQTACDVHDTGNGLNASDAFKIQQYATGVIDTL